MPRSTAKATEFKGTVEVDQIYSEALTDIEGFERIWLIFALHKSQGYHLMVQPPFDTPRHGLFATRSPNRPNPIGLSLVRLRGRKGNILSVQDVDMLDGTPLLDIKPYIPHSDAFPSSRAGWLACIDYDKK